MRVLILGGSGMLGHKLFQVLGQRCETYATVRDPSVCCQLPMVDPDHVVAPVSIEQFQTVEGALDGVQPAVVINCIGLVKQLKQAADPVAAISVNALFPHRLAAACGARGVRLIHLSTDCVFSGNKGSYREDDVPDGYDLYGRTKLLGEVAGKGCLTLRTSMIGRELVGAHGLIEWFFGQKGKTVKGYNRAIFSGFTTLALADLIGHVVLEFPALEGLWHVAAPPINKCALLTLIKEAYGLDVKIEQDEEFVCDRSLDAGRFRETTGLSVPSWSEMIESMRNDPTPYEAIRGSLARE
jgi:dTDP-4-dehydrorhamnose reductase